MNVKKAILSVGLDKVLGNINPNIYGHFIEHIGRCIYSGIWVGENSDIPNMQGLRTDIVESLRAISPPVFRWPGGCFADAYRWEDGIGPREQRSRRRNLWWGGEESNEFGTDEFIMFCRTVGAEPYICLNVGSGNPQDALSWLEYCNCQGNSYYAKLRAKYGHTEPYGVKYWSVGNENWGCGGHFDPVYYAWEYRRFATYLRPFSWLLWGKAEPSITLIACGHTARDWNLRFMEAMRYHLYLIDCLSIHFYSHNPELFGGDIKFTDEQYFNLLNDAQNLEANIQDAIRVVDYFSEGSVDPFSKGRKDIGIAVDEWGVWHPQATLQTGFYQQNTLRDAIYAAVCLNLFNKYSSKVVMANLSQTVNVLQSLFLTRDEKTILTPTYHVYKLYQSHMRNNLLAFQVQSPIIRESSFGKDSERKKLKPLYALDASVSLSADEKNLVITLVNQSLDDDVETEIRLVGEKEAEKVKLAVLNAEDVRNHNDFDAPDRVNSKEEQMMMKGKLLNYVAPKHSVNRIVVTLK